MSVNEFSGVKTTYFYLPQPLAILKQKIRTLQHKDIYQDTCLYIYIQDIIRNFQSYFCTII